MIGDKWGRDPGVQRMRVIFGKIEQAQNEFLSVSGVWAFDERLRDWRRAALTHFEHSWGQAARKGVTLSDDEVAVLYVTCLARTIQRGGVKIPSLVNLEHEKIDRLLETDLQ